MKLFSTSRTPYQYFLNQNITKLPFKIYKFFKPDTFYRKCVRRRFDVKVL